MKKIFTFLICLSFCAATIAQSQVRVGDPGVTFDMSKVPAGYEDDVNHWITAGVEGGIPFASEQFDRTLDATNSAGITQAIQEVSAMGGFRQIKLNNGTYTIDAGITMADSVRIIGESRDGVILNVTMATGQAFTFSCEMAGVENLTVQGGFGVPNDFSMTNANTDFLSSGFYFSGSSRNCWLDRLTILNSGNHAITSWRCSHITVRDCYIERAWNKGGGGRGYVQFSGDHCLMYNCVVKKMRHICIQREGCHHNVFYKNIVEQDFNFHSADAGHNLVQQNVSILPEGLGSGWHSVMGPWSRIHRIPGEGNVVFKNAFVENNNSQRISYSSDSIVYSPVDFEWNTPVIAIDTIDVDRSFYPVVETGIATSLELINPATNSNYEAGFVIPVVAKSFGDFDHVKLLDGGVEIARDTIYPYFFGVNTLSGGSHTLSLQGETAAGETITTSSIVVSVGEPSLTMSGVTAGQEIVPGNPIRISADHAGFFKKVSLYVNGHWKASDTSAPYEFDYSFTATGNQTVSISGQLHSGAWITPPSVTVNCVPLQITNLEEGELFSTNETINIESLSFGDFQKVSLYVDGSWKKTDWSAPYSYSLSDLPEGEHSIYLLGRTNAGSWHSSSSVTINVLNKDLIIVSPENNHVYESGATLRISAKAIGSFEKVSLYVNGSWKKTDHSAPFVLSKSGLADGTYDVYLQGKKTDGSWPQSNHITVTIGTPAAESRSVEAINLEPEVLDESAEVSVFPNPFVDQINLQNVGNYNRVVLFDLSGRMVDSKELAGDHLVWIPQIKNGRKGVFILQLKGNNGTKNYRLIRK